MTWDSRLPHIECAPCEAHLTLTPGAKLGPYEILSPLGAGGMGEVYRARDTRLNRDVAIKVLPSHLSRDAEARARFDREAKAISSFNHPHICTLFDVGRDGGVDYLVLELLEGESLAARVAKGPLPLAEVLRIGSQIAGALDKAHQKGLVHRDLKPGNVILTRSGAKLLDFGLARPADHGAVGEMTSTPTMGKPLTAEGTIVGTFQYMAPEQVEGSEPDPRSDVWALGATLYEMATGKRAFEGRTQASLISSILRDEPRSIAEMVSLSPRALDLVVARCLAKNPDDRWQSAGDLAFALQNLVAGSGAGAGASAAAQAGLAGDAGESTTGASPRRGVPVAVVIALVVASGAISALAVRLLSRNPEPITVHSPIFTQLTDRAGQESAPSLSPDGTSVAYAGREGGSWDIYVQRVGGRNATVVAGDPDLDENAPVFSPDGGSIAYHESDKDGGIFVVGATGESARRVTEFGFHPSWSPDGKRLAFGTEEIIVPFSRLGSSQLWTVDLAGGAPRKIHDGDAVQPAWSPSGERIAFWAAQGGQRDIHTLPAEGGPAVAVTADAALDWAPTWSPDGHALYFASDRGGTMNLWRVKIEEATGRRLDDPEAVTSGVFAAAELPSFSRTGRLAFRSQVTTRLPISIPFDPATETLGEPRVLIRRTGSLGPTGVSKDGRWLTLTNFGERQEDVFISRADGSDLRRITDDSHRDRWAVWSPDGKEISFYSNRSGNYECWTIHPDGSGLRRITEAEQFGLIWGSYSPSGDRMAALSAMGRRDAFIFDPTRPWKEQNPQPLQGLEVGGKWLTPLSWSPDGRRILGPLAEGTSGFSGLGVYDVESGKAHEVPVRDTNVLSAFARPGWLSDNHRAITVGLQGMPFLVDVDTGRLRALNLKAPNRLAPELIIVSPDERTIYASEITIDADIWLLETETTAQAR